MLESEQVFWVLDFGLDVGSSAEKEEDRAIRGKADLPERKIIFTKKFHNQHKLFHVLLQGLCRKGSLFKFISN